MQKTLFFILASDMMSISVKLSAEGQNAEGKLKDLSISNGKTAYNLSNELMDRVFGKGNYTKASLSEQVAVYSKRNVIPRVPATSTDLSVLCGMLLNEKIGLANVNVIHLESGEKISITDTLSKKLKTFAGKLESIVKLK